MVIRSDNSEIIKLTNIESFKDKATIRKHLLAQWSLEVPHTKYRYIVESISTSKSIYLERPGRLNKGCDFVIYAEELFTYINGNDKPPKHDDLLLDIQTKKNALTNKEYQQFLKAITTIYECGKYASAYKLVAILPGSGLKYEVVLKLLRWFFIEQDITYWAKSGREMLYKAILDI